MFIADHKLIIIIIKSANICISCIYRKSFWPAYSQLGMLGAIFSKVPAVALTATVTELANKIHQLPLEWWIKKSLQWTPIGRGYFLHMFNMTTHWWWHNQSAASSVHSKTTNYERWCLLQWFIPIYLHTAIVDIVYWQYNWNFWPQNSIPWLRIFLTWSVYLICIANYSKVKLQVDHLFLKS